MLQWKLLWMSRLWHCERSLLFTFAVFVQRFCHASVETPVDEQALALQEIIVIHFHCAFTVILMMARLRYSAVASCLDLSENKCVSLSFLCKLLD